MTRLKALSPRIPVSRWVRARGAPLLARLAGSALPPAHDLASAEAQIAALAPHLDTAFYASWYGITADPVRDFLVHGWRAGRDPRPDFSCAAYLAAHPYLARAGINPFLHALARRAGSLAGAATAVLPPPDTEHALRLARRLVDGPFYRAGNPDLQAAGVDPADHYMASGWREGREPAPQFDTLAYCLTHAITYATQNPLVHYVLNGGPARPDREAGLALRVATLAPYFDAAHYRAGLNEARADALAEASDAELLRSYVEGGWRAFVSPRPDFDPAGFVQARAGSRAVRDDPFFRYVAETRLWGPSRSRRPAAGRAGGGRGLVPGDLPGCGLTGAVPALCRFGLAGAARSGPGSLDPRRAAAGVRAAAGPGADGGHGLARGDRAGD